MGACVGLIGVLAPVSGSHTAESIAGLSLIAAACVEIWADRFPLFQRPRNTPRRWTQHPTTWAAKNGVALGTGMTTRIGFGLWYVVPISIALSGSVASGVLIGGVYGFVRTAGVIMPLRLTFRRGMAPSAKILLGLIPAVRLWTAAILLATGVYFAIGR